MSYQTEDMPPPGGITDVERQRFMQWALWAKGEPIDTPVVEAQESYQPEYLQPL